MPSFLTQTDAGALAPRGACLAWWPERDTGGGVPTSIAPRTLGPSVTDKEPGEGTGLGRPDVGSSRPEAGAMFHLASIAADAVEKGREA